MGWSNDSEVRGWTLEVCLAGLSPFFVHLSDKMSGLSDKMSVIADKMWDNLHKTPRSVLEFLRDEANEFLTKLVFGVVQISKNWFAAPSKYSPAVLHFFEKAM